jgi:hypothetical protein
MKIYVGVDHGEKGALVALSESGEILHTLAMPLKDGKIDCFQVYSWLYENFGDYEHEVVACGERLHAIFKASASSTFTFGKNVGKVVGIIECLEMDYHEFRAVDWQRHIFDQHSVPEMGAPDKKGKFKRDTKAMAAFAADLIWPELNTNHDGIIDALLIAEYGRQTHRSN